ncbi:MAG: TIM-barrel domain-containing protein [Clostridia bacterium]
MLHKHLIAKTRPKANDSQIVLLDRARITVLTPELIRVETDNFVDEATQIVWYRDLPECKFTVEENTAQAAIKTTDAEFIFDKRKKRITFVVLNGEKIACNNKQNLKGTARTLDFTAGKIPLQDGIIGKNGVAVMEDKSLILKEDGTVKPRTGGKDIYIFASKDYKKSLFAFFMVTGFPPMIPRYALGNWWSRYHAYSEESYLALLDRFQDEGIPFSVATVDMDWHWVKVNKKFNKFYGLRAGWTGYSWNTDLFPDYKRFLLELNKRNYRSILNLHPAQGVRDFEDAYGGMCQALGVNPNEKKTIPFDITDTNYINAYFSVLHKPYEKDGVDAWWIDWQQGKKTKIKGYDPLWALNHLHTLDRAENGERPLILSRYAGLGSHRYPLGFSGDTIILWRTLDFQPYFTATAANAGYVTWSHDIGGHCLGNQDSEELYLRWVQFGVFSPVMRLHSTSAAKSKEPWFYPSVESKVKDYLRLRHRLIPYIYSAYYRAFSTGRAISEPMYYEYPHSDEAHLVKNEYFFGENLIVAPITSPIDKETGLASVEVWLPKGKFTDIFTGESYHGDGFVKLQRPLDWIPVLAKEGAIIPFSCNKGNDTSNPEELDIFVYSGSGEFVLYEDDCVSQRYLDNVCLKTRFSVEEQNGSLLLFTLHKAEGDTSLVPAKRKYNIIFKDVSGAEGIEIMLNGEKISPKQEGLTFTFADISPEDSITISLKGIKKA